MSSQHILLLTPGRPVLYTTTRALFPVLLPTSPTAGDVCKEFKKTGQFVSDLQICCHFTTQNSKTDIKTNGETNTFPICLVVLSEQLVLSLRLRHLFCAGTNPFRTFVSDIFFSKNRLRSFRTLRNESCYGPMVEVKRNIDTKALCVSDFE
jgi:hypothetical protein